MEMTLWKDKAKKQIDPTLFSSKAEEFAATIFKEGQANKNNKYTQLRKFYDEVLKFDGILKTNPDGFEAILPYINMLNAKVAYAMGRELVSEGFKDFISKSIRQIKDKDDFDVFIDLFESFIGYYKFKEYEFEKEKKDRQNHRRETI